VGGGIFVAGGVCLVLMDQHLGSRAAWISSGAIVLVAAALVWPVLGTAEVATASGRSAASGRHRWSADALRLVLCYGAFGLAYIIPATFLPVMARQLLHDPSRFGWAWPVFGVAAAVSTMFAAPLMRALGDRTLWISSALVMAFGIASPLLIPGLAGIIVAALFVGGTFVVVTMAGVHVARATGGAGAETLVAAFTAAFAMGQIVGPLLVSFFASRSGGFDEALLVAAGLMAVSALALAVPVARTASMRG
jgi:MFS family permease